MSQSEPVPEVPPAVDPPMEDEDEEEDDGPPLAVVAAEAPPAETAVKRKPGRPPGSGKGKASKQPAGARPAEAKRHRKYGFMLTSPEQCVRKSLPPARVKRLLRKSGSKRNASQSTQVIWAMYIALMRDMLQASVVYAQHCRRKTVTATDVRESARLKLRQNVYSYDRRA